ncbi:hypothetical protein Franean1_6702 [Parafrankia sp. EAN1pec]|uniref:hypothetical protein n=1 Tax=Parafrankia sp. (strain EAN1pec) TaxID=298653 RepID=UPI00015DA0B0|nr:hypothetical protein Franean1_6702 [Frankia sp. EAN1pec]
MRVTKRRASLWRHPVLTPGYAAAIAFGAVALSGVVVPAASQSPVTDKPERVTGTVAGAPGFRLPAGLTVQIRHGAAMLAEAEIDTQGRWSVDVVPGDHEVCVVPPAAPVRVAGSDPASVCSRERIAAGTPTKVTLEQVQVVAKWTGEDGSFPTDSQVTISYAQRDLASKALDLNGRFTPSELPLNAVVCLDPPTGWWFADTKTRSQQCQSVTNPAADVLFRLEKS